MPELTPDILAFQQLRRILGPHASDQELRKHLECFSLDTRKATNGYLRSVCMEIGTHFDFQLRPSRVLQVDSSVRQPSHPKSLSSDAIVLPWQDLDLNLFPAIRFLSLREYGQLLFVSKTLLQSLATHNDLWTHVFETVFREEKCAHEERQEVPPCETNDRSLKSTCSHARHFRKGNSELQGCEQQRQNYTTPNSPSDGTPRDLCLSILGFQKCEAFRSFQSRWRQESQRMCPRCNKKDAVLPVVHGFPSTPLVTNFRQGRLILTENCGFLGPPWKCKRCLMEWEEYPFWGQALPLDSEA